MQTSLINRYKAIVDQSILEGVKEIKHYVSATTMRAYKLEIKSLLESAGISFYEDRAFLLKMTKDYHENIVARGILTLIIDKNQK